MSLTDVSIPGWHELFMRHVYLIASKSKDLRTRVGSIIVKDNRIISEGYNGICQGVSDEVPDRFVYPAKSAFFEHAERNSIYSCARVGVSPLGASLYTQGMPCADCGRALVQSGIKKVYLHEQWRRHEEVFGREKWVQSCQYSELMFKESKVEVEYLDLNLDLRACLDGKIIFI